MQQLLNELPPEEKEKVVHRVRCSGLEMVAQVHWRLLLQYEAWPYPLVGLVDPSASPDERLCVAQARV